MCASELLVHAWALNEGDESAFIHPLVYVDTTLVAFQVPCGLNKLALSWFRLGRLLGQDLLDVLGSGLFLRQNL